MADKLVVKSSPHVRSAVSTQNIMRDVLIALTPAVIASFIIFGLRSLMLITVCAASCVVFEYLFRRLSGAQKSISDLSAIVTGVLLALNLPVSLPLWMAIIGCAFAIIVAKQIFGGLGQNFVNPAIAARIMLLLSFTTAMTKWSIPSSASFGVDLITGATPLSLISQGNLAQVPSLLNLFLGIRGGCIGETSILALFLGGGYLLYRKVITPTIPLTYLGTVVVFSLLVGVNPIYQLFTGGVVLGAIFMATDYVTSPTSEKGKFIFAVGCGLITMIIRIYGSYPEGVSFAILFMNILTPHIDNLTRLKPFGGIKK